MSAPAKKATPKKKAASGPSTIVLICKAISSIKAGNRGASRAAIANYICNNFGKEQGGRFNAALRAALKKGVEAGVLKYGESQQRFKFGENSKSVTNPPKPKKKKVVKKKSSKKKTVSKKKKTTKKKTTKKKATKKKTVSKKKSAKKAPKKKTTKKKKATSKSAKK